MSLFARLIVIVSILPIGVSAYAAPAGRTPTVHSITFMVASAGLGDHSLDSLGYVVARTKAHQYHLAITLRHLTAFSHYMREINAATQRAQLVVASNPELATPLRLVAPAYPHTHFVTVGATSYAPNVLGNTFRVPEGAYLAGVLAAGISTSHVIGFVGAFDDPSLRPLIAAFRAGAYAYNRHVRLLIAYTNSFTSRTRGLAVGTLEIKQGADVLYPVGGVTALGVLDAANDHHVYGIGSDVDQHYLYPRSVVTSIVEHVDVALGAAITAAATGHFQGGTTRWGLANNGVGLAPYHNLANHVSARVRAAIAKARSGIVSRQIMIPSR